MYLRYDSTMTRCEYGSVLTCTGDVDAQLAKRNKLWFGVLFAGVLPLFPSSVCQLDPLEGNDTVFCLLCELTEYTVLVDRRCRTPLSLTCVSPILRDSTCSNCLLEGYVSGPPIFSSRPSKVNVCKSASGLSRCTEHERKCLKYSISSCSGESTFRCIKDWRRDRLR